MSSIMDKEQIRKLVGANIRREREARQMSMDDLATMLNLTPAYVGLIERGYRGTTASILHKLANIFGVTIDTFFADREGNKTSTAAEDSMPINVKRKKIMSLLYNLSELEMDHVILFIKGIKGVRNGNE